MLDYKTEAHHVFNRVRWRRGISKAELYAVLASRMGVEERKAHFGNMITLDEVLRATRILEEMESGHKAYWRALTHTEKVQIKALRKKRKEINRMKDGPAVKMLKTIREQKEPQPKAKKISGTKRENTLPIAQQRIALEELRIMREKREKYPVLARFCPWLLDRM